MKLTKPVKKLAGMTIEILMVIPCICICIISKFLKRGRSVDVGLGPLPLINNVYHKTALRKAGFSAETFVSGSWFITNEFDLDLTRWQDNAVLKRFIPYYLFCRALFRYRVLFIYFNGGPFILKKYVLHALEPIFYKVAKVKIVVMPYGGDVQTLDLCKNLYFRHAMVSDYPKFWKYCNLNRLNIDRWTCHADWVISGCDWVEYMYHWDSLMLGHFSIDVDLWAPTERKRHENSDRLRILHAPNHPTTKRISAIILVSLFAGLISFIANRFFS